MVSIRKNLGFGAGVGFVGWLLGRTYGFATGRIIAEGGIATTSFSILPLKTLDINVQQQIIGGVDPSLAGRLLAVFGGGEITLFMGLIMAILAGITVAFVGTFVVDALKKSFKFMPTGKGTIGTITAIMVYGTLISSALVGFLDGAVSVPNLGFVIASIIYFLIIGWAYVGLRGLGLKQLPLPE